MKQKIKSFSTARHVRFRGVPESRFALDREHMREGVELYFESGLAHIVDHVKKTHTVVGLANIECMEWEYEAEAVEAPVKKVK
jgi:hypothetical protein